MKSLDDLKELGRFEISFLNEDNAICHQKISDTEEYKSIKEDLFLLETILNNISNPTMTRFLGRTIIEFIVSKDTSASDPMKNKEFKALFTKLKKVLSKEEI